MSTPFASNATASPSAGDLSTALRARQIVTGAVDAVRGHVRRIDAAARGVVGRLGNRLESFVGAKIRRRVKPPIVLALIVAAVALAAAVVALVRK